MNGILAVLFSLSGTIFGMILSLISPEEILPGKKYFLMLRRALYVIISLFIIYSSYNNFHLMVLFFVLLAVLFSLDLKFKRKVFYLIHYSLFLTPYFFINEQGRLILVSLIFLYGFPVGTLLRAKNEE